MDRFAIPLRQMLLRSDGEHLCAIAYADEEDRMLPLLRRSSPDSNSYCAFTATAR